MAVREYQTDVGPADYVLFVDKKSVGVIEVKREDEGFRLTQVEDQSTEYAWEYNQVAALFDDINMLKDGDGHLLGMILLHTQDAVGSFYTPELTDSKD